MTDPEQCAEGSAHEEWDDSAPAAAGNRDGALPMIRMYGIKNCDTVKKARAWLEVNGVAYDFQDYKSAGIDEARLRAWAGELGWERLLNRAGTTFRKLPDADKEGLDEDKAIALMLAQPSMIKRPVLDLGTGRLIGFREDEWRASLG
jgi:arsenate reductase